MTLNPYIAVPATLFSRHVASKHWCVVGLLYQIVSSCKDVSTKNFDEQII